MWLNRLSLQAGDSGDVVVTFTEDTLIGNLWTFLGSPAGIQNVDITIDGADLGNVIVTADWTGGSTFQFTCINGGRIIGLGGDAGDGGDDNGASGNRGDDGDDGGLALSGASGFTINVDIDDGYLMGGGGGGGGGSWDSTSGSAGDPGCGGGGGAGFSVTAGGDPGSPTGLPAGIAGNDGGPSGPGTGGVGIGTGDKTDGGAGGQFGAGGDSGMSSNLMTVGFSKYGGVGGRAGRAFVPNGATLTLNGSKLEATLRAEERLKGEITSVVVALPTSTRFFLDTVSGASTHGYDWKTDGTLTHLNGAGGSDLSGYWISTVPTASFGDDYEVRIRNRTPSEDQEASWGSEPVAQGTFVDVSATRTWSFSSSSGTEVRGALFEVRLASQPTGEIIDSIYLGVGDENGA